MNLPAWVVKPPLTFRLRATVIYALAAALALAALLLMTANVLRERERLGEGLWSAAVAAGSHAAQPLGRGNRSDARKAIAALDAEPGIRRVTLFDDQGAVLFDFAADGSGGAPAANAHQPVRTERAPDAEPIRFEALTRVHIQVVLASGDRRTGLLLADADLTREIFAQSRSLANFLAIALTLSGLIAYLLTHRSRNAIAEPIGDLTRVVREALDTKNYAIRADRHGGGGIGRLVKGFNGILEELERRDTDIRRYRNEIEKRVRERTADLDREVAKAQEIAKRAEGASRAKSDFLARMSHEIRTPMNGVLGMAELLRQSPTLDDRQRRYAVTIHQSGTVLLQIINDILDFSKIEAGKLELESARFCVRDIVEDAVEILAERAHNKGLELICDIPLQIETKVRGDGLRLRQVLINLISNAVKFTERGEITIKVSSLDSGLHNSSYRFEVRDTGIGIKAENCAAIFESFSQEDSSTTRRYGGTGLGLAICKQLVELMGGEIGVTSEPGVGSTFYFSVALESDESEVRDQRATALNATQMLIVDDNPAARAMMRQHLSSWGITATEAGSGREALETLGRALGAEFDVVIIDAQMPEMSGVALARRIRSLTQFADTPLVMLNSGMHSAGDRSDRATVWLNKPVRKTHLHACLVGLVTDRSFIANSAAPAQDVRKSSRVRRVLLVEDNPVNQEVARAMLREIGVEPDSAWNGEEALEKMTAQRYEIVLMDCQMPKLDGYAATSRFREWEQQERRPRTPIVALTANALAGDAEKCLAAGMDGHLGKPFTIDQLHEVLNLYGAEVPNDGAVLDQQALERIRALNRSDGPDLFSKVVGLYTSSSLALIEDARTAAATNDAAGIMHAAHALKSSSANVGATALAALCKEVELAASSGKLDLACMLLERLLEEHQNVLRALGAQSIAA